MRERNQSETYVGCIVSFTTTVRSSVSASNSVRERSASANRASVRAVSYLRRKNRRSMSAWMRRRKGRKRATMTSVVKTMMSGDCSSVPHRSHG